MLKTNFSIRCTFVFLGTTLIMINIMTRHLILCEPCVCIYLLFYFNMVASSVKKNASLEGPALKQY